MVHEFSCPGYKANCIDKTNRTLFERTLDHGWINNEKIVYQHLNNCEHLKYFCTISIYDTENKCDESATNKEFRVENMRQNIRVTYSALAYYYLNMQ